MPHEQAPSSRPEEITDSAENSEQEVVARQRSREVGARILTAANFDTRHKDIVESSFAKAKAHGEKLPGKNNERRNYAYLSRMENLVNEHGNELEKRLWQRSADKLIVQQKDIPESYWRMQEQILRDNGQGRKLNEDEKATLTADVQKQQRDSLRYWVNYLGNEQSPYPMWFKLYAWDGMSKMGVFDTKKKEFAKRDKSTVAPYPKLNPAALGKLYGAICRVYGIDQTGQADGDRDDVLDGLVKSGNFNKLYSQIMLNTKAIVKTPERTEDVRGEWKEYLPGDEEALADAAEGTPWCVADPGTGKNYLEHGEYNNAESVEDSKAKFILFHLEDPKTGALADNACASIRLDVDGKVAEISGLKEGQALEDSLVPIVEAKAKTLPGGEDFLEAFADKRRLIELDHKMQAGQAFTSEDLDFIFETKRRIKTLDTYNSQDPRLPELQNVGTLLKNGADPQQIVDKMSPFEAVKHLDQFQAAGAEIDTSHLLEQIGPGIIADNLSQLLSVKADPQALVNGIAGSPGVIAMHLPELLAAGAKIDVQELAGKLHPETVVANLSKLLNAGAKIDLQDLVDKLSSANVAKYLPQLTEAGAEIDVQKLADEMAPYAVAGYLPRLQAAGAKIDVQDLVGQLEPSAIALNVENLVAAGANLAELIGKVDNLDLYDHVGKFVNAGADLNQLLSMMESYDIVDDPARFLKAGADWPTVISYIDSEDIVHHLRKLIQKGARPEDLIVKIDSADMVTAVSRLLKSGADMALILDRMSKDDLIKYYQELVQKGIDEQLLQDKINSL